MTWQQWRDLFSYYELLRQECHAATTPEESEKLHWMSAGVWNVLIHLGVSEEEIDQFYSIRPETSVWPGNRL